MNSNDAYLVLIPLVLFFFVGVMIRRHERSIRNFYWMLREASPKSYVKQNKIIRLIRKLFGLKTDGSIHRMICLYHAIQIFTLFSPMGRLFVPLFVPPEYVSTVCCLIMVIPVALCFITYDVFTVIQHAKCKKIQKKYPAYAKIELYRWRKRY